MKKLAVMALSLFLVSSPSLAKTSVVEKALVFQKRSVLKTPTRTRNALVRAVPRAQRRLLVTNDVDDGDDGPPGPNELDLHSPYRRPQLSAIEPVNNTVDEPDEISDYATVRLVVARAKAMEVYRKHWC